MRRTLIVVVVCSCLVALSCQKSAQPPASNAVTGTWNLVSVNVQSRMTTVKSGDTSISYPNYITQHNTGTITFTIDSMAMNGIGYTVDTTFYTYFYLNGIIVDTVSSPLIGTVPATSTGSPYKMVNTDSLYFPNSGAFPIGVGASPTQGQGVQFVVSGDTLRLTSQSSDTTTWQVIVGKAVITLVKQH